MKFIIGVLFLFINLTPLFAQRDCASAVYAKNMVVAKPGAQAASLRDTLANEIINIPVVIHVLYKTAYQNISTAQIQSQLDVLNQDYRLKNIDASKIPAAFKNFAADTKINFCLARVDPTGTVTSGIIRKYTTKDYFLADDGMKLNSAGGDNAWNTKMYLNIWVCQMFGRSLGYATPPGGPADKDGVVINFDVFGTVGSVRAPFDKGRTTTHEVGHWLGLKHIWGDEDCGSDDVDDTPRQLTYNFNCPTFPRVSYCSPNGSGDMFMNYMDLTNDACMYMFTNGQKSRMRSLFASGGLRNAILNAYVCDSTKGTAAGPLPELPPTVPTVVPKDTQVVSAEIDIQVYPNPVSELITIQSKNEVALTGKTARIYSSAGRLLQQQVLQGNTNKLNIRALAPGLYVLQVGEGKERKVFKIVKL